MSRTITFFLVALLLLFSACSPGGTSTGKEPDMTPNEALTALEKNSIELLEAIADKGTVSRTVLNKRTPCGGLGGNEFNKVKHTYAATGESEDDLDSILEAAETKMTDLGLSISGPKSAPNGTRLSFRGDGFRGALTVTSNQVLALDAATECLDNPDQWRYEQTLQLFGKPADALIEEVKRLEARMRVPSIFISKVELDRRYSAAMANLILVGVDGNDTSLEAGRAAATLAADSWTISIHEQ